PLEQLEVEIELPADALEGASSGAAVPAAGAGVSPANTNEGVTPPAAGETPAPLAVEALQRFTLRRFDASTLPLEGFEYRLKTPQGISNPILLCVATAPVVAEQEPNNQLSEAQKLSLPCEVAGQF